eukprot:4008056-Pyramimonas_sp.AAC.1
MASQEDTAYMMLATMQQRLPSSLKLPTALTMMSWRLNWKMSLTRWLQSRPKRRSEATSSTCWTLGWSTPRSCPMAMPTQERMLIATWCWTRG